MNIFQRWILSWGFVRFQISKAYKEGRAAERVEFLGGCPKCGQEVPQYESSEIAHGYS